MLLLTRAAAPMLPLPQSMVSLRQLIGRRPTWLFLCGGKCPRCRLGRFISCRSMVEWAAIPLYRRSTSQDDIERGKVRYHQVRIFARIFLQIRTSPGKSMVTRCFVDGQRLWTRFPALSKPYFSMSWDFGSERAGNRVHSFGCLTEAWIISAMYVIIT